MRADPLEVFVDNQIKDINDHARIMSECNDIYTLDNNPVNTITRAQAGSTPLNFSKRENFELPGNVVERRCTSAYIKMAEILAHVVGTRMVTNALHSVNHISNKTLRAIAAYYEIPVDFLTRDGIANMLSKVLFTVNDTHETSEHAKIYASELAARHEDRYEVDATTAPHNIDIIEEDENATSLLSDLVTNMSAYDKRYYRKPSSLPDIGTLKYDSNLTYDPRGRAHQRFVHADGKAHDSIHATLRWTKTLRTYAKDIMRHEAQNFFMMMLYLVPSDDALLLSPINSNPVIQKLNKLFRDCGAKRSFSVKSLQQLHNREKRVLARTRSKTMMRSVLGLD